MWGPAGPPNGGKVDPMSQRSRIWSHTLLPLALTATLATGSAAVAQDKGEAGTPGSGQTDSGQSAERLAHQRQKEQQLARQYIDDGDQLREQGLLRDALGAYSSALELDPTLEEARRKFDEITQELGLSNEDLATISRQTDELHQVGQEAATRALDQAMKAGDQAADAGDFRTARDHYEDALFILRLNPDLPQTLYTRDAIGARISEARRNIAVQEKREQEQVRQLAESAATEKQRRVEEHKAAEEEALRDLARQAFDLGDYEAAVEYADALARARPADLEAQDLLDLARRERSRQRIHEAKQSFGEEWQRNFESLPFHALPQTETMRLDEKVWARADARKPLEFTPTAELESSEEQEIERRLESIRVHVDFENTDIQTVAEFFAARTGVNFLLVPQLDEALSDSERLISLKVDDTTVKRALDLIAEIRPIRTMVEDGVVKLVPPELMREKLYLEFYDIRDLTQPIVHFPSKDINLRPSVGFFEEEPEELPEPVPVILEGERLIELIRSTIDPESWNENPDATINIQHGTLVVNQSRHVHRMINDLLQDLRASAGMLVSIESRFLLVEENFLEDIGIDYRGLGDDSGGVGVAGGGTGSNTLDDVASGTPAAPSGAGTGNDTGLYYLQKGDFDVRARSESLFDQMLGGGNLQNSGGLAFQYTYLEDIELEAILRAVEKDERTQIVNAPSLLVHDSQRANLSVLNQVSYVRDFEVEVSQAAVIADPVIDVIQDGVILDVLPIVSADRRFVTLEIRPTVATLDRPIDEFQTSLGVGNPVTLQLPALRLQRVRTTVTIPDGGILLLGGARFYTRQELKSGIPWLSKLPGGQFFFGRSGRFQGRQQLLILLKVKVVVPEDDVEELASRL